MLMQVLPYQWLEINDNTSFIFSNIALRDITSRISCITKLAWWKNIYKRSTISVSCLKCSPPKFSRSFNGIRIGCGCMIQTYVALFIMGIEIVTTGCKYTTTFQQQEVRRSGKEGGIKQTSSYIADPMCRTS